MFDQFRSRIRALSIDERLMTAHWRRRCDEFARDAQQLDPNEFLRWPSLTDFSTPEFGVFTPWYEALRADPHWQGKWFPLTREVKVGRPHDFSLDFGTSPLLVQHAYHLKTYEDWTGKTLAESAVVFEFGGGYGSFVRLLRNAGFHGLHIIYDLPHVHEIQRLFLTLLGIRIVDPQEAPFVRDHAVCLIKDGDLPEISRILVNNPGKAAFVATWSMSEAPVSVREALWARCGDCFHQFLIAYQQSWETIDNRGFFARLQASRGDVAWREGEMPHFPGNYYLCG